MHFRPGYMKYGALGAVASHELTVCCKSPMTGVCITISKARI